MSVRYSVNIRYNDNDRGERGKRGGVTLKKRQKTESKVIAVSLKTACKYHRNYISQESQRLRASLLTKNLRK